MLVSSSLVQAVIGLSPSVTRVGWSELRLLFRAGASELDQDFDRFPFVHRPVAVGNLVEAHDPVEDSAGFDPALEDVRYKLLDVGADRGGPAAHGEVVE